MNRKTPARKPWIRVTFSVERPIAALITKQAKKRKLHKSKHMADLVERYEAANG